MSTYPQAAAPGPAIMKAPTQVLGRRTVAQIIDWVVLLIISGGLWFAFNLQISDNGDITGNTGGYYGASYGVLFLYFWLFEWLFGATVGKWMTGIRVRKADGSHAGFIRTFARTILRIIDYLPFFYGIGWIVAMVSGSDRRGRIGDLVGGTYVVRK